MSTRTETVGRRDKGTTRLLSSDKPQKLGRPIDAATTNSSAMGAVLSWEEIPLFDSEEAEAQFWASNRIDVRLMDSAVATGSEELESVTMTLRIDPRMLARIKRLARSRYLNYQSMIKQWLSERMEQETRER